MSMPSVADFERGIEGAQVVTEAFAKTVRLVTTARLRESVLKPLIDDEKELAELAEIEGATSNRLVAQNRGLEGIGAKELIYGVPHAAFINASFAYAKPRALNRFNGPSRGAWYAALDTETCLAEVTYHMNEFLKLSGLAHAQVDYSQMFASLAGAFVDLRGAEHEACLDPDPARGYPAGNALAERVRGEGLNGIIYPSVRLSGGTCIVALWPHAVQSVAQGGVFRLTWNGAPEPDIELLVA